MNEEKRLLYAVKKYSDAFGRLKDAVKQEETPLSIDGTIQRFEFTFELSWKTLQKVLKYEGYECRTPRECLRKAFSFGIISDEDIWLDMLEDRNRTSHVYNEAQAREIYGRINTEYIGVFEKLKNVFEERYKNE